MILITLVLNHVVVSTLCQLSEPYPFLVGMDILKAEGHKLILNFVVCAQSVPKSV